MDDAALIDQMKNALAITIQNTIAQLGFMPNECGPGVKQILKENNEIAFMALGCYLEDCQKQENYGPLHKGLEDIKSWQERGEQAPLAFREKP